MSRVKFDTDEIVIRKTATDESEAGSVHLVCADRAYRWIKWNATGEVSRNIPTSSLMYLDEWRSVKNTATSDYWTRDWQRA